MMAEVWKVGEMGIVPEDEHAKETHQKSTVAAIGTLRLKGRAVQVKDIAQFPRVARLGDEREGQPVPRSMKSRGCGHAFQRRIPRVFAVEAVKWCVHKLE